MLEVQAAIGRLQLRKLPEWHARRHAIGSRLDAALGPAERLPVARELGETSLCFLCHPTLTDEHVGRTIEVVAEVVGRATR